MGRTTDRPWDGGYVRKDKRGRETYYIHRRVGGVLYEISTRCRTSSEAHEQLKRFEADPAGYRPPAISPGEKHTHLSAANVAAFLKWSLEEKQNSKPYVEAQKKALAWWMKHLGEADFRTVKTARLVELLDAEPGARKWKVASVKVFATWLVTVRHVLTEQQNPTLGLRVPQSRPEQWTTPKAIAREEFEKVRGELEAEWKDALDVLAGTGWHVTELQRFASGGAVEPHPMRKGALVLACPRTKGGEQLRTEVSDEVAQAAKRVRKRGQVDYFKFRDALAVASAKVGVDPALQPGHMRHSVATWAVNAGAPLSAVSSFLGHKSERTTRRFYATHAVAAKVPTLR